MDEAPAPLGPARHRRGDREPGRALALARAAQRRVRRTRPRCTLAFLRLRGRAGEAAGRSRTCVGTTSRAVGHHAAQGRRGRAVDECSDQARRLDAVNCVVNLGGTLLGANTDGEGFVASLARGADFDPAGPELPRRGRRRRGAGGGAGAGRRPARRRWPSLNRTPERARTRPGWRAAGSVVAAGEPGGVEGAVVGPIWWSTPRRWGWRAPASGGRDRGWLVAPLLRPGQIAADLVYAPRPTRGWSRPPRRVQPCWTASGCSCTRRRPSWPCGRGESPRSRPCGRPRRRRAPAG